MEFYIYSADLKHSPNEFCLRTVAQSYFISYFRNDYLIELDGRLVKGRAGDFIILPPGETLYYGPQESNNSGHLNDWMYFGGEGVEGLLQKYPVPVGKPFNIGASDAPASAINKIHEEKSFLKDGYSEKCDIIFIDMFIDIYRAYKTNADPCDTDKLLYVRGVMLSDIARQWHLCELAGMAGYSVSRFSNLYKSEYGVSPMDDLMNIRIERAKLLIRYGSMPLGTIAEQTGFSSIYYFSRQFKKKEGISPSEFKKKL